MFKELDELCNEAFDFDAYVNAGKLLDDTERLRALSPDMRAAYEAVKVAIAYGCNGRYSVEAIAHLIERGVSQTNTALMALRQGGYVSWESPDIGQKRAGGTRVYKIEKEV